MLDTWLQDARFALRLLRKSPLFTVTAAMSLAIGIGANATIFSAGSAMLLRPMPGLANPERLVDVGRVTRGAGFDTVSYPNYADLRERTTSFTGLYAYELEPTPMSLGADGGAERVYGVVVTANYFSVLGTPAHLGRLLVPEDDGAIGANAVVVLSHHLWERRFASDRDIVGRSISINGFPFTVVGVAARDFQGTTVLKGDLWLPVTMLAQAMPSRGGGSLFTSRRSTWLFMGARLKDGVSVEQANAELATIGRALEQAYPDSNKSLGFRAAPQAVVPGVTGMIAGFLGLLMGIVTLLLLIACVNLAGMQLARGAARSREMAVRVAIGAGPGRIVRQLLTETAVLFVLGGVAGLLLSRWLTALLLTVLPQLPVPIAVDLAADWRVVAFTAGMSLAAAILCGLAPALQARRTSLVPSLKGTALESGGSRLRMRSVFVVGQVTMSLVLVIAAGLFMRTLAQAANAPTGFDHEHVDVVSMDLSLARYTPETGRIFARELLMQTGAMPGVQSASIAVDLPLDGGRMGFGSVKVPGSPAANERGEVNADWNVVEPALFRTLGQRLVKGRDFTDADTATAVPVAIVNEAFARAVWPGADPLGQQFESDGPQGNIRVTIVGVASDARLMSISEPAEPYVYAPLAQRYSSRINLLVKTSGTSAIPALRATLRTMNPNLPVTEAMALSEITALGLIPQRIAAAVAGALGVVGLLLAAIGIFGVTAYAVTRRTREIGIRVALGADHQKVMRLLLRQGLILTGIGLVLGLGLAAIGAQLIQGLLYGVNGIDPITFGSACVLFAIVSTVATYIPARRALRVDPMVALRND
ncbi:MAG: ABC transporter permease [Acidobacteriota bacterium]|nr:ABC transporter permease [Acidobacteriota bacterium]